MSGRRRAWSSPKGSTTNTATSRTGTRRALLASARERGGAAERPGFARLTIVFIPFGERDTLRTDASRGWRSGHFRPVTRFPGPGLRPPRPSGRLATPDPAGGPAREPVREEGRTQRPPAPGRPGPHPRSGGSVRQAARPCGFAPRRLDPARPLPAAASGPGSKAPSPCDGDERRRKPAVRQNRT